MGVYSDLLQDPAKLDEAVKNAFIDQIPMTLGRLIKKSLLPV
jgi:hypothetical protein